MELELMTLIQNYKLANWRLEQIQHAAYEYGTWKWWYWTKIIDLGKFGPKIENWILTLRTSWTY